MRFLAHVLVEDGVPRHEILAYAERMLLAFYAFKDYRYQEGGYPCNPNAKWDQLRIGGRWAGLITRSLPAGTVPELRSLIASSEPTHKPAINVIRVVDLPPNVVPAAIVDRDGRWHDGFSDIDGFSKMDCEEGWKRWASRAKGLLDESRNCCSVLPVECHTWTEEEMIREMAGQLQLRLPKKAEERGRNGFEECVLQAERCFTQELEWEFMRQGPEDGIEIGDPNAPVFVAQHLLQIVVMWRDEAHLTFSAPFALRIVGVGYCWIFGIRYVKRVFEGLRVKLQWVLHPPTLEQIDADIENYHAPEQTLQSIRNESNEKLADEVEAFCLGAFYIGRTDCLIYDLQCLELLRRRVLKRQKRIRRFLFERHKDSETYSASS